MNLTEWILSNPIIFNLTRKIIAGDQKDIKNFVKQILEKYNCQSVLDIGFGTGDYIETVPQSALYLGIDISQKYLSFTKNKYAAPNRQFLWQDATESNFFLDKKFDAVLLISIMHHLKDDELDKVLSSAKKTVRKVVILSDIIPDPPGKIGRLLAKFDRGRFVRSKKDKIKILEKYFKIKEVHELAERWAVHAGVVCEI